VKKST